MDLKINIIIKNILSIKTDMKQHMKLKYKYKLIKPYKNKKMNKMKSTKNKIKLLQFFEKIINKLKLLK